MDQILNDFSRLVSHSFGRRTCYFAAWRRRKFFVDSCYGLVSAEMVRAGLNPVWEEVKGTPGIVTRSGRLQLSPGEEKLMMNYQGWKFDLQEYDAQGILMVLEGSDTENLPISLEEIRPWLDYLTSSLDCYLTSQIDKNAEVYKAILDNSSEFIVLVDRYHKVLEFNSVASKRIFEFTQKEIKLGEDFRSYILKENRENYLEGIQKALRGEKYGTQVEFKTCKRSIWLEYQAFPVYNFSKALIGVCLQATDITQEKTAYSRVSGLLETFNALINNLNESLVILSRDYSVIQFNTLAKERLKLNINKDLRIGADFREFIYSGGDQIFLENFHRALKGELVESEGTYANSLGENIWLHSRYIPIYLENGELLGVGLLSKNIHEQKTLQLALKESEEKFRKMVASAAMAILIIDVQMKITMVNPEVTRIFGYSDEEIIGQSIQQLIPNRYHQVHSGHQQRYAEAPRSMRMMDNRNIKALKKNGEEIDVEVSLNSFQLGDTTYFLAMILDVTEKNKLARLLNSASELTLTGNWEYVVFPDGEDSLFWSSMTRRIFEVPESYAPTYEELKNFFERESFELLSKSISDIFQTGEAYDLELMVITWDGKKKWVRAIGSLEVLTGNGVKIYGSIQDITQKKLNEIELIQSLQSVKNYKEAIEKSNYVLVTGLDGNVIDVNDSWCELTEYTREELIGASSNITKSDYHSEAFFDELWDTIRSGKIWKGEIWDISKSGKYFWVDTTIIPLKDDKGEIYQYLTIRNDITEKKKVIEELEIRAKELARSNAELEQFAYVASHDLQEPLRMVTSFLTLLKRKHATHLDESALKYIDFAVDGALRMKTTILDLLEFSRVGKSDEEELQETQVERIIHEIGILQKKSIEESSAQIICENLPSLRTSKAQLMQVFGNLISNAIKYRKPDTAPLVRIAAKDGGDHWVFSVQDNGIGFSMEYSDKVFVIFQRLHTRETFSGNGIGLAVVRKVIENLHGKIWVESVENEGSIFYFTLPK